MTREATGEPTAEAPPPGEATVEEAALEKPKPGGATAGKAKAGGGAAGETAAGETARPHPPEVVGVQPGTSVKADEPVEARGTPVSADSGEPAPGTSAAGRQVAPGTPVAGGDALAPGGGQESIPSVGPSAMAGLRQMKVLGAVIAPTSLLTALAYYFGWLYAFYYFDYLGVNQTVLGQGTVDYLLNAVDSLFRPIAIAAAGALLAFWAHALLRTRLASGLNRRTLRILLSSLALAGLVLASTGMWSVIWWTPLNDHLAAAPLVLAVGVLILGYTVHLWRFVTTHATSAWRVAAEWTLAFVIVGICLFWAASQYATAVGRGRAHELVTSLPYRPPVVLYSQHSLSLTAPGVRETHCRGTDATYHYRYEGLRLIRESSNQYLLLPAQWSQQQGVAVLLPRNDSLRLEFRPAAARDLPLPATC